MRCIKCEREEITRHYCHGTTDTNGEYCNLATEHLVARCTNCGYRWYEQCADAEVDLDVANALLDGYETHRFNIPDDDIPF